jgi:hypothetical protein
VYLRSFLCEHAIWRDLSFWEDAFSKGMEVFRSKTRGQDDETLKNTVFGHLGSYVITLLSNGMGLDVLPAFLVVRLSWSLTSYTWASVVARQACLLTACTGSWTLYV